MLYKVKVKPSDYEEIIGLMIIAESEEEALKIAKKEVNEHDCMSFFSDKRFEATVVDLSKSKVLSREILL